MKLTQGARNVDVISSAQFDRKLAVAMTQTPTIMRTLFNPEEIATMSRLARAIKRAQPEIQNPSKTAYKAASIIQQSWNALAQSIGFSQGGIPGAIAGRGAAEGGRYVAGFRGMSKAKDAVSGPVRPLQRLSIGNVGAASAGAYE